MANLFEGVLPQWLLPAANPYGPAPGSPEQLGALLERVAKMDPALIPPTEMAYARPGDISQALGTGLAQGLAGSARRVKDLNPFAAMRAMPDPIQGLMSALPQPQALRPPVQGAAEMTKALGGMAGEAGMGPLADVAYLPEVVRDLREADTRSRGMLGAALALSPLTPQLLRGAKRGVSAMLEPRSMRRGQEGIFAGISALTADKDAYMRAIDLEDAGVSRADIYRQTGWFRGPDKKWRFEISDEGARFDAENLPALFPGSPSLGAEGTLGQGMEHARLFDAYPQLKEMPTYIDPEMSGGSYRGTQGEGGASIAFGKDAAGTSPALHETQHAIQEIEGFARGGSPQQFKVAPSQASAARQIYSAKKTGVDIVRNLRDAGIEDVTDSRFNDAFEQVRIRLGLSENNAFDAIIGMLGGGEKLPDIAGAKQMLREAEERYKRLLSESVSNIEAFDQYNRLAGEVEARTTQGRQRLTAEQRAVAPPWSSGFGWGYDVPEADQIVKFRK